MRLAFCAKCRRPRAQNKEEVKRLPHFFILFSLCFQIIELHEAFQVVQKRILYNVACGSPIGCMIDANIENVEQYAQDFISHFSSPLCQFLLQLLKGFNQAHKISYY